MNKYAVIGNPIEHSKSPQIHSAFARQEGYQIQYDRILAENTNFKERVDQFVDSGGLGLNVTVPFKILAYELCDQLTHYAQSAKAVNTISFNERSGWQGHNTDGIGLLRDLTDNKKLALTNKKILVLGAGGATRGILLPLLEENPNSLIVVNRTTSKATELANEFSSFGNIKGCGYEELGGNKFDLLINATSASLNNDVPPVPNSVVDSNSICYDLAYSDKPTSFLNWAVSQNVQQYFDGIGMLIEQAAESYFIWRGYKPDTQPIFSLLRS